MASRYYSQGLGVYQRASVRKMEDGREAHSMGFRVATIDPYVVDGEAAAQEVAKGLNLLSMMEEQEMTQEMQILKASLALG